MDGILYRIIIMVMMCTKAVIYPDQLISSMYICIAVSDQ